MNAQNLLSQMMMSKNPMQMIMGLLSPQQKQTVSQFQSQPSEKQAEAIAKMCNEKGITKEQLASIISQLRGGK